jgi:hypothetical protein
LPLGGQSGHAASREVDNDVARLPILPEKNEVKVLQYNCDKLFLGVGRVLDVEDPALAN